MSVAEKTCRTCGKASEEGDGTNLFPLYDSYEYQNELEMTLEEFEIWNLNISQNDGLPQKICINCFDSFCQIHNFRLMCIEAQMNFGEMCTGLDIIIKDEHDTPDEYLDFQDEFSGEQIVSVQEHYTFPGDECVKPPLSPPIPEIIDVKYCEEEVSMTLSPEEETVPIEKSAEETEETHSVVKPKEYKCDFCMGSVRFDDPDQLNDHYNQLHSSKHPYNCPECERGFATKSKRNYHIRVHDRSTIDCEKCGKKIKGGKEVFQHHYDFNHVEEDRECPTCGKKFEMISEKRFSCHMSSHNDSKLHKCRFCDKKFVQPTELIVHEKSHTGEFPYSCSECKSAFQNKDLLNEHKKTHANTGFGCPECLKRFSKAHHLYKHMYCHRPGIKYPHCDICNVTYRAAINLRVHNYTKHDGPSSPAVLNILKQRRNKKPLIKPYKCPECVQEYVLQSQLEKHLKTHGEDRPFKCSICLKNFKRETHLKLHVDALHLNKKPFKCTICGWAFPQRNNLRGHMMAKHERTKDFKCKLCGKGFATSMTLKTHMLSHSDKKPFICTICSKGFKQLAVLKHHMNVHLLRNEVETEGGVINDIVVDENLSNGEEETI